LQRPNEHAGEVIEIRQAALLSPGSHTCLRPAALLRALFRPPTLSAKSRFVTPDLAQSDFGKPLKPPGGMIIWVFIFMELLAFGLAFSVFAALRVESLAVFEASQRQLDQGLALINTVVLLTSGYFVVLANGSYDRGNHRQATCFLAFAIGLGLTFVLIKAVEYRDKIAHGLTTGVNQFFDFYWLLTAFHLFHVLLGIVILAYMARKIHRGEAFVAEDFNLRTGGAFWHMCDLIWVLLFPILYLI
jgi:nitric oxide reductase NorE protein